MTETYDEDYFERGVEKGISGYTQYHWKPEYFLPLANELKKRFNPRRVLDYGTAKGFMVKAFHLLNVEAWGYDVSEYAVQNADPYVRKYISNQMRYIRNDLVIAKDVLEHVPKEQMQSVLLDIGSVIDADSFVFIVVPLGDDGVFRIREYELDKTHVIKEDEEWWINTFNTAGYVVEEFYYSFPGAKDHWQKINPYGNGIFILRRP